VLITFLLFLTVSETQEPILRIKVDESKVTSMLWGPLDETIISGHENGKIVQWDLRVSRKRESLVLLCLCVVCMMNCGAVEYGWNFFM
jgi:hypothetical protein